MCGCGCGTMIMLDWTHVVAGQVGTWTCGIEMATSWFIGGVWEAGIVMVLA